MSSPLLSIFLSGGAIVDVDGSLFIQLAIFFIALFLLNRFVFQPMLAVFDAREAAIGGAKREARELEAEAEAKLKAFEAEMKKVKVEASADRDSLRQDAARLERELLNKARQEAEAMSSEATETMNKEAAKIRTEMKARVPVLASQIAERLLGRSAA